MICQPCGQTIEEGQQAIYGINRGDGRLTFGWTCCHQPVGDVDVILGSGACTEKWLAEHPEDEEAIRVLLALKDHGHGRESTTRAGCVIRIVGNALWIPGPEDGQYLKVFRPDTDELGRGELETTPDRNEAMQFPSTIAAWEFWKQQSVRCPLRDDGKKNLPLTAFTIEIETC